MEKKTKPTPPKASVQNKTLSKPRIFFGVLFVLFSVVLTFSFISYLLNWKSDQSQAGTMLDKTVQSSNIFGKIGDWLGNIFIFESIGIAAFAVAFLFFVVGMMIFKKNYFKPWKTIGHSLFFICWLPIFMGAVTKGHGVLSGVYGFQIMDFLLSVIGSAGLWLVLIVSIGLYFILEFNLNPANVKAKLNDLNENTVGRVKAMMPNSSENFEADEELEEMQNDSNEILPHSNTHTVPLPVDIPVKGFPEVEISNDFETIKTPNKTSFDDGDISRVTVTENFGTSVNLDPATVPTDSAALKTDNIDFKVEVAKTVDILDDSDKKSQELVDKHGLYDHKLELGKFQMPTLDLLRDYGNEEISINRDELEENKNKIVGLLKNFNVGIAEIKATV
ncbi:MAG: DNA translocase FtsK 4TM domain-containing protein, partial [Kaistella sp.]